jgi:hypothetical protein
MATANTIGRIVGQSPEREAETEDANPLAKIKEIFDKAKELYDKIKEMVEKFKQLAEANHEEASGASEHGASEHRASEQRANPPVETPEHLRERLTALGATLGATAASMEGPPRRDQAITRQVTQTLFETAMRVSNAPGAAIHTLDLAHLANTLTEVANTAPTPEQRVQAVDNAATMARLRGAKPSVLEVIQSVYETVKAAMELLKSLKPQSDGAQVKEG